ncbi:MAG: tRNA pseudouridine(55) synthase TruB [Bacteroidales bacterium]
MDGLLVIDKPVGPTSHDVVARVRRATGWSKVGHTGTLDPLASGVLPLVVGRATRLARFFSATDKEYVAEVRLGYATDTYDALGVPASGGSNCGLSAVCWPDATVLEAILDRFRGTYLQAPPAFSAKKIEGTRAYALARQGHAVAPGEVAVTVHELGVLECQGDRLRVRLSVSAGFYVRSFADALGRALGPGAHMTALRRVRTGEFGEAMATELAAVERAPETALSSLLPLDRLLAWMPTVVVNDEGASRTRHGNSLRPTDCIRSVVPGTERVRVLDERGRLLALARASGTDAFLHPDIVVV